MIKRINKLCNILNEISAGDVGNALGRAAGTGLAKVAGNVVTGLARASGLPILAGASDILGNTVNTELSDHFNKIFKGENADLNRVNTNNYYFYNDVYAKYQAGSYGYDINLNKDRIPSSELSTIKRFVYPSFQKFGYGVKFVGKRTKTGLFYFILFKGSSVIPFKDSKRNPIIYVLPMNAFKGITDEESSDAAINILLEYYGLNEE